MQDLFDKFYYAICDLKKTRILSYKYGFGNKVIAFQNLINRLPLFLD